MKKKRRPTLRQWCTEVELIDVSLNKQYWSMEIGLKYDKKKIAKLEKQSLKLSEYFLKKFDEPKELIDICIAGIAGAKTYRLSIKFKEDRYKKIRTNKYKFNKQPVSWNTWRQFAAKATDKQRKEVFDTFIKLTPKITPIIKEKFETNKKIYAQYGTDALSMYLRDHQIKAKPLIKILKILRDKSKKTFKKQFQYYSKKILNKKPEYYDDLYFVRNAIFKDMIAGFKKIDGIKQIKKAMREMGLNPNKIKVDTANRPKKYASPFCYPIKVPTDVRLSYKPENPLNDANSMFHEFGHGIHESSIDKNLPYWIRNVSSMGLAETFSTFFEHLMTEYDYLIEEMKFEPEYAKKLIRRINFMKLFGVSFYTGNSLFRIAYWKENLKFKDCNKRYAKELKKSMGMKIPGAYWQLHHILPSSLMYVPSYMVAEIQQEKIKNKLRKKYGNKWWKSKQAGKEILKLMRPGMNSEAADFSKLTRKDINNYVKSITRKI